MKHFPGDVVGSAVRTVDHQFHAAQIELGRKRTLAELDIPSGRVADTARLTESG